MTNDVKQYSVVATVDENGLSADQTQFYSAGSLKFWLDPSATAAYAVWPDGYTDATTPSVAIYVDMANSAGVWFSTYGASDYTVLDAHYNTLDKVTFAPTGASIANGSYQIIGSYPTEPPQLLVDGVDTGYVLFSVFSQLSTDGDVVWLAANNIDRWTSSSNYWSAISDFFPDINGTLTGTVGFAIQRVSEHVYNVLYVDRTGNTATPVKILAYNVSITDASFVVCVRVMNTDETNTDVKSVEIYVDSTLVTTITIASDGNGAFNYVRDNEITIASSESALLLTQVVTFGSDYSNTGTVGSIGDVLVYAGSIDDTTLATQLTYLKTKWLLGVLSMGAMASDIAIRNQIFATTVELTNAGSATIRTIADDAGSNWTISKVNSTTWSVTGKAPASLTNFKIVIKAYDAKGNNPQTSSYPVYVTEAGTLSTEQQLFDELGVVPAIWLDPSDTTTLTASSGNYTYIRDKATTYGWAMSSSEVISTDDSTFSADSLAFSDVEYSSGFNTIIALDANTCSDLVANPIGADDVSDATLVYRGVPIADSSNMSTVFMVLSVDAPNFADAPASFKAYSNVSFTSDLENGVATAISTEDMIGAFGVSTTEVGVDPYTVAVRADEVSAYGGQRYYSNVKSENTLAVGSKVLIVFRYGSVFQMRVNQVKQPININFTAPGATEATVFDSAWLANLNSGIPTDYQLQDIPWPEQLGIPFVYPRFVGMLGSENGYVAGSSGEFLAFQGALDDNALEQIENFLVAKWFASSATAPTITTPTLLSAYVSSTYTATVTITNGSGNATEATISATAGSDWTITQASETDPTIWTVTGTMPSLAGETTVTITGTVDGLTTEASFVLTAIERPAVPDFGTLTPTQAATSASYTGTVIINNMTTVGASGVTIQAAAGSGWTIAAQSEGSSTYVINGTMPSSAGSFNLVITATNTNAANTTSSTATATYSLHAVSVAVPTSSRYALDLTGVLAANKIKLEQHTLTSANGADRQMIVPILGPFYAKNLLVQYKNTAGQYVTAELNVDYVPVCEFYQLSDIAAYPLYGAIGMLNVALEGTIYITYQSLGGDFVIDKNMLYEKLAARIANPRQVEWSAVTGLPNYYPVNTHEHELSSDIIGMSAATTAVEAITTAESSGHEETDLTLIKAHIAQTGNVHNTVPADIGLEYVNNYPIATVAQAVDSTNDSTYLTPMTASAAGKEGLDTATSTSYGITQLNLGTATGDDANSEDALTAAGIMALMNSADSNLFKTNFSGGQVIAKVSPYPMTFPLYWKGLLCRTLAEFISRVETYADIYPLQFNSASGEFYFPQGSTPPNLGTSQTQTATKYTRRSVSSPVSVPLSIPDVDSSAGTVTTVTYTRSFRVTDTVADSLVVSVTETV